MTCAASVTKEDFPGLIVQLWDKSFNPAHLTSGFQKMGLCLRMQSQPLSCEVPPFSKSAPETNSSHSFDTATSLSQPTAIKVIGTCRIGTTKVIGTCRIGTTVTPMRLHLWGYFSKLPKRNDKTKATSRFYGEALTLDEVAERYAQEASKIAAKRYKANMYGSIN